MRGLADLMAGRREAFSQQVARWSRLVAFAAIALAVACADLKALMDVASAIQDKYHMPASINVNNGTHMAITFQNADVASMKLDSAGMYDFARGVAAFAKAHYAKGSELEAVSVGFATVSSTGPITVTRRDAPYEFRAAELN